MEKNKVVSFDQYLKQISCEPLFYFENNRIHVSSDNPKYKVPVKTDSRPAFLQIVRNIEALKTSKRTILENSYVPIFAKDYHKLPWYERDLMAYFDHLDYKEMSDNPTKYFHDKKVINFDIIHHECRGDKLSNSYKHYKTVKANDLKNYPDKDKKETLSGVFRNVNRDDLWVQRDLMLDYFKKKI